MSGAAEYRSLGMAGRVVTGLAGPATASRPAGRSAVISAGRRRTEYFVVQPNGERADVVSEDDGTSLAARYDVTRLEYLADHIPLGILVS